MTQVTLWFGLRSGCTWIAMYGTDRWVKCDPPRLQGKYVRILISEWLYIFRARWMNTVRTMTFKVSRLCRPELNIWTLHSTRIQPTYWTRTMRHPFTTSLTEAVYGLPQPGFVCGQSMISCSHPWYYKRTRPNSSNFSAETGGHSERHCCAARPSRTHFTQYFGEH